MKQYHNRFEKSNKKSEGKGKRKTQGKVSPNRQSLSAKKRLNGKGKKTNYIKKDVLNSVKMRFPEMHQQIKDYVNSPEYRSQKAEELAENLGWNKTTDDLMVFLQMLRKMELDYEVVLSNKNRYMSPKRAGIFSGVFLANAKGFGFVKTEEPNLPDIYIHSKKTNDAMHNDKVLVQIYGDPRNPQADPDFKPEGEVLKITERANEKIIGVFDLIGRNAVVFPDEKKLNFAVNIPYKEINNAEPGDKVVAEITLWGNRNHPPMGRIIHVLGNENEKGVDMLSIMWQHHLPEDFNPAVLKAAEKVATAICPADWENRRDMREQPLITIDGIDAKDLDDAVSARELPNGNIELSVHIADVAHYVKQDSVIDREAFSRGTSVYLPDRVLPMLPRVLSNGICSLNAGVDRLAMSCTMEINEIGNVENYDIYQSVIRVDKRMDYDTVNLMLMDKDEQAIKENAEWLPMLQTMEKLQKRLAKKRWRHGAINFNMPETKVIVDFKTGETIDVVKREQRLAEGIIEQAMVAANETVATHFNKHKVPFVYRVHEGPGEEKLRSLNMAIMPLGFAVEPSKTGLKPKDFQKMLKQVAGTPEEKFVQTLALRSMCHAEYSPDPIGHFGLASRYYSHFTSPIRRYADLSIHRVIKECLANGIPKGEKRKAIFQRVASDANQASLTERLAEEAERDAVDLKCCQFMADKLGEEFTGTVSGVNSLGVWVELPNTIEGRIAIEDLPYDHYLFIRESMTLKGHRHQYRLGDEVKVIVDRVDLYAREIDFVPAE